MKQFFYITFFALLLNCSFAQNNARLLCDGGCLFTVYVNDHPVNKTPQASVLVENISKDTFYVKLEFESKSKYGATLYLLDKGQRTIGKEFNYTIAAEKNKLQVKFTGMYDISLLPDPIVPHEPKVRADSSSKRKTIAPANDKPKIGTACTRASSDEEIKLLLDGLSGSSGDAHFLQKFKVVYATYCYSAEQCKTVLQAFMHDRERLEAAKLLYQQCVEKEKFLEVTSAFTYAQTVSDLKAFVEKQK